MLAVGASATRAGSRYADNLTDVHRIGGSRIDKELQVAASVVVVVIQHCNLFHERLSVNGVLVGKRCVTIRCSVPFVIPRSRVSWSIYASYVDWSNTYGNWGQNRLAQRLVRQIWEDDLPEPAFR